MNRRSFMRGLAAVFAAPSAVIAAIKQPVDWDMKTTQTIDGVDYVELFSILPDGEAVSVDKYTIGTFVDRDEEQGDWIDQAVGRPKSSLHHALGVPYSEEIPKHMLVKLTKGSDERLRRKAEFALELGRWK